MKVVNYFVRMFLLLFVLIIAKSSTDIRDVAVENNNTNKTINLTTMAMKVEENEEIQKYTAINTYTGDLTGYAYNCPLCGGKLRCDRVGDGRIVAIVLDRGVRGNSLDLLTPSEEYASKYIGRSKITYDVLRSGWE